MEHLGPDVPLHFTAFHPDWKMRDTPPTPPATLEAARRIAREAGLRHVFTGNVHDPAGQSTYCHACGALLIGRDWYEITAWNLTADGRCGGCGTRCPGVFERRPGVGAGAACRSRCGRPRARRELHRRLRRLEASVPRPRYQAVDAWVRSPSQQRRTIAVGTRVTPRPPHRSGRAQFRHPAPTSGVWRRTALGAKDEGSSVSGGSRRPASRSGPTGCHPSGCAAGANVARARRPVP